LLRSPPRGRHTPRKRSTQYAAAYRFNHWRLWNTGSPAFADDDSWGEVIHTPRHCEPTGRANARPMTGSAKQSIAQQKERVDCFASLSPKRSSYPAHAGYPVRCGLSIQSLASLSTGSSAFADDDSWGEVIHTPRHCERSEAIHSFFLLLHGLLRRFAPRNDGKYRYTPAISRRGAPEVCN
jgi:hypothetical protein